MDIPTGFKETEVGVIPSDWEIVCLNDCLELLTDFEANGSFEDVAKHVTIFNKENFAWYVRATDLENNSPSSEVKYVDEKTYKFLTKTKLFGGEVLITKRGEIGKVYFFEKKTEYATVAPNMYLLKLNEKVVPYYIFSFFKSIGNRLLIEKNASTTLGALYKNDVKAITFAIPTKAEQTAIATALNDADALITQLEQLIAKKRLVKEGAMQALLTGKTRLDGFHDDWITKSFPDVCWFQEGPGLRKWQFTKSGMKVINVTNLENGILNLERTDRHISFDEFNRMYQHFAIDENDIVVASSGNSYGKVAVVRKQDLPLVMNTSVIRFKPLDNLDYHFLLAFLKSFLFKDQIDLLITGGAQPNFGPAHLKKINIKIPASLPEQTRIARILSDMDAEIGALEGQLEKWQGVKAGMMQVLLTGKIRLI